MAINSKRKGARFERALASKLREYGYECRRGQQYCGANGDAKDDELPAVFHKKNNCEILVTMPLDVFMDIYREWEAGREELHKN